MASQYLQHRRDCRFKQAQRAERIRSLTAYHGPLTDSDRATISQDIEELVHGVKTGALQPLDILKTYGKVALQAHERTNCLTEVMISSAERWLQDGSVNLQGPLAGIPVSLKDTIRVAGYDATAGYSRFAGHAEPADGPVARLLKDAGAVPYVKTNLPITLLSFESANDVWGRTTSPHGPAYTPGGSTGGESALLALGGRIGIGSDIAGSVRVPAHFAGCYSVRCSTGRWPKAGYRTSTPGQEGVPGVYSPMARTLRDLTYFTRAVVGMRPWEYDYTVHPLPWRHDVEREYLEKKSLRFGVIETDGVVDPSPAVARALETVRSALEQAGHQAVVVEPPSMYDALVVASQLLVADGGRMFKSFFRTGEWEDPGARQLSFLMNLPRPLQYLYYLWVKYVRRDSIWAGLIRGWYPKSTYENFQLVIRREDIRSEWHDWWNEQQLDFLLVPPNATPAVPHGGMHDAVSSCGYTFLFNLLDYSAGVVPVTKVDKELDRLPAGFNFKKLNGVAQGAYKHYDATAMHGLPVGVQIVGRRLEEEKVLAVMARVEEALGDQKYELLELD